MLKIYGADLSSPANKVRFVANYLNLEYQYNRIKIRDGENKTKEFLMLNPVGKIPVIDADGFVLFESDAIIKYLAVKSGSEIYPREIKAQALVDQWMNFISLHVNTAIGKVLYNRVFVKFANGEPDERSIADGLNFLKRFLPIINNQLLNNKVIAGDKLTLADFTLLAALDPVDVAKIDISEYRSINAYLKELRQEEFYTKCHRFYGEQL